MVFVRNTAETQGGAISALFPSDSNVLPVFNTRCFIQYKGNIELDSSEWNVSVAPCSLKCSGQGYFLVM